MILPELPKTVFFEKTVSRGRGRPRKVELLPVNEEVAAVMKKQKAHLKKDPLIAKVQSDPSSMAVMDELMEALATEISLLEFRREYQNLEGQDTSALTAKRITAMKSLQSLFFQRRSALVDQSFDFKSVAFERLLEYILLNIVQKSAVACSFMPEQINILFDKIGEILEDERWMDEAMAHIKS